MSSAEIQRDINKLENNLKLYKQKIAELEASIKETINLLENNEVLSDVELSAKLKSKIDIGKTKVEEFYSGIERIVPAEFLDALNNGTMRQFEYDGIIYNVPNLSGIDLLEYSKYLQENGINQNSVRGWDNNCDALAKRMAIDLSGGWDSWLTVNNYKSISTNDWYGNCYKFDDQSVSRLEREQQYLNFISSELAEGRYVTVNINNDDNRPGAGAGGSGAHWIVVVGVTNNVAADPGDLKNYLVLDPVDGMIKTWDSMKRSPNKLWVNTSYEKLRVKSSEWVAGRVDKNNSMIHHS